MSFSSSVAIVYFLGWGEEKTLIRNKVVEGQTVYRASQVFACLQRTSASGGEKRAGLW